MLDASGGGGNARFDRSMTPNGGLRQKSWDKP